MYWDRELEEFRRGNRKPATRQRLESLCISWTWSRQPVGYSRLIPYEYASRAMSSVSLAQRQGVKFHMQERFSGIRITVVSLPCAVNNHLDIFED